MVPRQRKDYDSLNINLEKNISERLKQHCAETGIPKTVVVEKALTMLLDDYEKQQEIVRKYVEKNDSNMS